MDEFGVVPNNRYRFRTGSARHGASQDLEESGGHRGNGGALNAARPSPVGSVCRSVQCFKS